MCACDMRVCLQASEWVFGKSAKEICKEIFNSILAWLLERWSWRYVCMCCRSQLAAAHRCGNQLVLVTWCRWANQSSSAAWPKRNVQLWFVVVICRFGGVGGERPTFQFPWLRLRKNLFALNINVPWLFGWSELVKRARKSNKRCVNTKLPKNKDKNNQIEIHNRTNFACVVN